MKTVVHLTPKEVEEILRQHFAEKGKASSVTFKVGLCGPEMYLSQGFLGAEIELSTPVFHSKARTA